jgi:hypothetical protein
MIEQRSAHTTTLSTNPLFDFITVSSQKSFLIRKQPVALKARDNNNSKHNQPLASTSSLPEDYHKSLIVSRIK